MTTFTPCANPDFHFGPAGAAFAVLLSAVSLVSLAVLASGVVADVRDWWRKRA